MIYKYAYSERFLNWEKPNFKTKDQPLILWGAGKIGGVAAHCLKKRGIEYEAFCDIAQDKWGTNFCGHKIISPIELKKYYPRAAILITTVFHNTLQPQLAAEGFTNIYDCSSLFMEIDFDGYDFWMTQEYAIRNVEQYLSAVYERTTSKNMVDQVFLNITTKCTLHCRQCSLFVAYVDAPCNYAGNDIIKDLYKLLDGLGHIRIVNLYGGEPLLHPELGNMIRSLSTEKRIDRISIITNGTLVPSDDVLSAMKNDKRFLVRISDYGSLSSKIEELKEILDQAQIKYEITNYAYWDETSKIGLIDSEESEIINRFRMCTAYNVLFLMNRKAYLCSTGSAVCNMGVFPESPSNYLELNGTESSVEFRNRLHEFLLRPQRGIYMDACKYCSGNHCTQFEHKVPVAEQAEGRLKLEKIY